MFALLLRRVRIDEDRLRIQHFARELARGQDHVKRILKAYGRRIDRHALITEVLVQHEIDATVATDDVQHAADAGVMKIERDRLRRRQPAFHRPHLSLPLLHRQAVLQRQQIRVATVVPQRLVDQLERGIDLTGRGQLIGLSQRRRLAPPHAQVRQQATGSLAAGIESLGTMQRLLGQVEVTRRFGRMRLFDQLRHRLRAREQETPAELRTVRVLGDARLERLHGVLIVALSNQLLRVTPNAIDSAACDREHAGQSKRCRDSAQVHQQPQTNFLPGQCIFARRFLWACRRVQRNRNGRMLQRGCMNQHDGIVADRFNRPTAFEARAWLNRHRRPLRPTGHISQTLVALNHDAPPKTVVGYGWGRCGWRRRRGHRGRGGLRHGWRRRDEWISGGRLDVRHRPMCGKEAGRVDRCRALACEGGCRRP